MTDNELIAWCKENILPKPVLDPTRCAVCGWPLATSAVEAVEGCVAGNCRMRSPQEARLWRPLDNRNDNQMVVDAMRAKGLAFSQQDLSGDVLIWFTCNKDGMEYYTGSAPINDDKAQMRAVLEAAHEAMEASNG